MNRVLFASKHFRMSAAMRRATMAVLVFLTATGGGAHVWALPNVQTPPGCPNLWADVLGGYNRLHAKCPGRQVTVTVHCSKGPTHQSSYPRPGYNKAECQLHREGNIVRAEVDAPPTPVLPPNQPHRPR
jgi:hypothetical protein